MCCIMYDLGLARGILCWIFRSVLSLICPKYVRFPLEVTFSASCIFCLMYVENGIVQLTLAHVLRWRRKSLMCRNPTHNFSAIVYFICVGRQGKWKTIPLLDALSFITIPQEQWKKYNRPQVLFAAYIVLMLMPPFMILTSTGNLIFVKSELATFDMSETPPIIENEPLSDVSDTGDSERWNETPPLKLLIIWRPIGLGNMLGKGKMLTLHWDRSPFSASFVAIF